jgi:hypothetical protein
MATVVKDFKIKSGLIVEGASASVNGFDVLTKATADQNYIIALIGGSATPNNTPDTVVLRDENGDFSAGVITADITGTVSDISNHSTSDLSEGTNQYFTAQRALDATASAYDVAGAAAAAQTAAEGYADGLAVNYDAAGSAAAAQQAAEDYADGLAVNYDVAGAAAAAQTAAEGFATQAIANLVDSAPETLDTLNELAAALQDNPDVISDLQDIAAGKQDELTAGANIDITGATISVTGLTSAEISDFDSQAVTANTGLWDTIGAAAAAQTAAEAYADALDTDDIEEGTNNLYHTDVRAKTSAASLLTGASLTNITITGDETGLVITAENGVADSDTDDLAEGSSNLYFTDQRAVDALEAVVPNFTEVDINSVATQVASTLSVATASQAVAYSFSGSSYRTAKFLVKVAYGSHTEVSEVLLTLDTSDNIAITEYAVVGTNGSASTISAGMSGTDVQLLVTTANNNSTVNVMGTLLA